MNSEIKVILYGEKAGWKEALVYASFDKDRRLYTLGIKKSDEKYETHIISEDEIKKLLKQNGQSLEHKLFVEMGPNFLADLMGVGIKEEDKIREILRNTRMAKAL